jgi:hypothetical protein
MKTNKKIVSAVSIAALAINLLLPAFAQAFQINLGPFGSPDVNINQIIGEITTSGNLTNLTNRVSTESSSKIEERYGINEDIWRSAKRKGSAPRADVFFDISNPKDGEKVTAHAIPEFFKNDPQNLYYTWYLIHTTNGTPESATNSIESGKREAAKIMARGDYDPDLEDQKYENGSEDPDKDGWPAVDANSYNENVDQAPMGGADGVGGLSADRVEEFSSADDWCNSLGSHALNQCSLYDETSYKPLSTYYTPKTGQNNHYCSSCENYFSEGGASSYSTAQTNRNNCCYANTPEESLQCSETTEVTDPGGTAEMTEVTDPSAAVTTEVTTYFKCPQEDGTDYCGTSYNSLFDSCYSTFEAANKSTMTTCLNSEYSSCRTNWCNVHELAVAGGNCDSSAGGFSMYNEEATTQVSRCYKHNFGTNDNAGVFRQNELSGSATSENSGLDYPVVCKHKWKDAPDYTSGSGKFPTGEEAYWKTDPTDPDTDGDGFVDEADVIGLGQQDFTWNYQSGDRVGVVVEGTSMMPTDEKTAYYKIMWGYLDVCDSSKRQLMNDDQCENSTDDGFGFLATRAPGEEKGQENLKISLSYSPDNPMADPSNVDNAENIQDDGTISDADEIIVTSSLNSTTYYPNNLYYTWQISEGSSPSTEDWDKIENVSDYFNIPSSLNGLGVTSLSLTPKQEALKGDGDISYFKVTLTVSTAAEVKDGRGRSSVIIGINKKGIKVKLYKVDINEDGKAVIGKEVCNEGLYKTLCPAVQNQMLAAKIDGSRYNSESDSFLWSLDGKTLSVPNNSDNFFSGWSDKAVFFPITGQENDIENITVTATSKDELNPVLGGRSITVVKPASIIRPSDSSASWPVTYTVENPNQKYSYQNVASATAFQALTQTEVPYGLSFVPDYLIDEDMENTLVEWSINGVNLGTDNVYDSVSNLEYITLENEGRGIKFITGSDEGQSFTLSAKVKKYWGNDERIILYNAWGIVPKTLENDSSITVTTTSSAPLSGDDVWGTMGQAGPGQVLAAVGTHLPHYAMYILRLALTLLVMFFVSIGFYGLTQKIGFNEEK